MSFGDVHFEEITVQELAAVPVSKTETLTCQLTRLSDRKWYVWIGLTASNRPTTSAGDVSICMYHKATGKALISPLHGSDTCVPAVSLMTRICEIQRERQLVFSIALPEGDDSSKDRDQFFENVLKSFMAL